MSLRDMFTRPLELLKSFFVGRKIEPVVYTAAHISEIPTDSFTEPGRGLVTWQTVISKPRTPTNALTAGIAVLPGVGGHLCQHRHRQPEIYHIISGSGVVTVNKVDTVVEAGSVVYIPGDAEHGIRNLTQQELRWLYVFPTEAFGNVKYRFSEKTEGDGIALGV